MLPFMVFSIALDARLEVGLEQQAELMLKMMSTLEADSILQALTNTSPTRNYILLKLFYLLGGHATLYFYVCFILK